MVPDGEYANFDSDGAVIVVVMVMVADVEYENFDSDGAVLVVVMVMVGM